MDYPRETYIPEPRHTGLYAFFDNFRVETIAILSILGIVVVACVIRFLMWVLENNPLVELVFVIGVGLVPVGLAAMGALKLYEQWIKIKALKYHTTDIGEYGTAMRNVFTGDVQLASSKEIYAFDNTQEKLQTPTLPERTQTSLQSELFMQELHMQEPIPEQVAEYRYTPVLPDLQKREEQLNDHLSSVLAEGEAVNTRVNVAKDNSRITTIRRLRAQGVSSSNIQRILGLAKQEEKFKKLWVGADVGPLDE